MHHELKRLKDKNLATAITLAKHYRDLNQPDEAESICRDVLEVAPDNVDALRTLGLAMTDRFGSHWMSLFEDACAAFKKLPTDYERAYYVGIAWERYAKAQTEAGRAHNAVHAFEQALGFFEEASKHAAKDDPAPILHFNRCVRALTGSPDLAAAAETSQQLRYEFGD
jgi:tetratricopeptide (TPR) repeat protein